jgi:hypothetical protein
MQDRMARAAKRCTHQIEAEIPQMTEPVVDVIAEQIQKEHVKSDVPEVAVQKGVADKLPPVRVIGDKCKMYDPPPKYQITRTGVYLKLQEKKDHIDSDQRVIYIRCPPWPNACPNGQQ